VLAPTTTPVKIPTSKTTKFKSLPVHPAAEIFPLIEGKEFTQLITDIKAHGLRELITVHDGMILDGRNRERACIEAGVEPKYTPFQGDDPVAFVMSKNIHRRHLTGKQKRELTTKLVKMQPEKSNRQIAELAKVDKNTVAAVRTELESTGEIHQLTKTVGKDGKTRSNKRRTEDDFAKEMRAKREAVVQTNPAAGRGNGKVNNPKHLLDAAEQLEKQSQPKVLEGGVFKSSPALKRLCEELKTVVERALNAKHGNKEHYTEVFAQARACIDEMAQAWGS
jgi:hypothetical protein